jgi:DNA-binding transcriptional LysR family regulator
MDRMKALSVFKAVADNGSFVAAASALDISCPVASRVVQDLETLLGVRLLHRTTRRLALTAVGEDVLRRAASLLQSYDELASIGRLSASEPAGVIRMAAPASFARHYLGTALATFRAHYPLVQVDLQLCEGTVNAILDEVDLALCQSEELRATQVARPLARMEVGIYAAPSYLAHKGEPTHPSQLVLHDCLTSRATGTGTTWSFRQLDGGDPCTVSVKGALHANQIEVLADAAAHGAGIVMLPGFVAQAAEAQGQLRRVLQGWRVAPLSLQLTYSSRRNQPMSVRKLIEHLVETLGTAYEVRSGLALGLVDDEAVAANATGRARKAACSLFRQPPSRERLATA